MHYILQLSTASDPATSAAVKMNKTASVAAVVGSNTVSLTGLTAETDYELFFVVEDAAGNLSLIETTTFSTGP
jgi:chitodextrinase